MISEDPNVPQRARENMRAVRRFEDEEEKEASPTRLAIERTSRFFGSPVYLVVVIVFVAGWIAVDTWGRAAGWRHMEPPPFFWLQGMVSLNALLLTVAVLIRQNRMAELAEHRARLDLQINMLTEQKVTRILELLGERATPSQGQEDLTKPVDPGALLDEIKKAFDE